MTEADQVVLLGLNEINFEFIRHYVAQGELPALARLLDDGWVAETTSESDYDDLEPWIQWVTIHTGLPLADHGVFRLGDIVDRPDVEQLFEQLEAQGLSVGAVSPFNGANRLTTPAFFFPDPWTQTSVSAHGRLQGLYKTLARLVNDNAHGRPPAKDLAALAATILWLAAHSPRRFVDYCRVALKIRRPGARAIALDMVLADLFLQQFRKHKPDFGLLFLNSGAHIQHHYLFNSSAYDGDLKNPDWYCSRDQDPLLDVLKEYDSIVARLHSEPRTTVLVATGLRQVPHTAMTYYWRPKDHAGLLSLIGVEGISKTIPRMSRDFLIELESADAADAAEARLLACTSHARPIFSVDNRGDSLFVELVHEGSMESATPVHLSGTEPVIEDLRDHVSFVAIKNGRHDGTGYFASMHSPSPTVADQSVIALTDVHDIVVDVATAKVIESAGASR